MHAFVTGGSGFLGRNLLGALRAAGHRARALARSDAAAREVAARGAEPARGDLDDADALAEAVRGCDVVFHCAALAAEWAPDAEWRRHNVRGTQNVLDAARRGGAKRVVHVSTEAVLVDGRAPLVRVDETRPLPERPLRGYAASKAEAERLARAASTPSCEVVVVRPRFIWGAGDTTLLPKLVDAVRAGKFRWIGGGAHLTSTCHVDNVCEGMLKAAEKGRGGDVYFLTDGAPPTMREMLEAMFATQGLPGPTGSIPLGAARAAASTTEAAWRALRLPGAPPITRTAVELIGREVTVVDDKARRELGYEGATTRAQGLAAMRAPGS